MFEDYIQDSYSLYNLAENELDSNNERNARMFYRASVLFAASSLEAFVNFVGETLEIGSSLDKNEIAFLNDKILEISTSKAIIEEKIKYNSIDGKIKFLIKKFDVPIYISTSIEWNSFLEFKKFRDSLIHSKSINDEHELKYYQDNIKKGLNANIDIMNKISSKLFSKPLRKSLIDLKL